MELKSNIKIKSDLYIRGTEDGKFSFSDESFTAQVKSRSALKKLTELAEKTGTELKLTDTQKRILGMPTEPEASQKATPMAEPIAVSVTEPNSVPETPVQPEKIDFGLDKFSTLDSGEIDDKIVKSSPDSKIVLDTVSYSEKIRIASERVEYILKNDPRKRILVLCGTDIAAERIKRGIKSALPDGSYIDVLDVFAAKHLFETGESAAKITALSKEKRLALFNDKMRTEDFTKYDYCVISDLDELVVWHVKTVLKILVLLQCGYLLLSDRRRAVLKHGTDSAFIKNANKLRDVLPENTVRFSLDAPKHALSDEIGGIMTALTEGGSTNDARKAVFEKMPSAEISALNSADGNTVVLCKDSGAVEYVSLLLHKNNIPHSVLRGDMPAPVRQLADILWDNHEKTVGRGNFAKRFIARCGGNEGSAEEYFNKLCSLTGRDPSAGLELARLAEVISLGGIPLELMNISKDRLAVAEIGSPCGKVFNKVYIADSGFNDPADAKLLYLAAAGRTEPPSMLKLGDMPDTAYSADGRCVHIGADGKAAFGMGCPEDIDKSSFIAGSMGDAVRKQAYISKNVKPGDSVTLKLNGAVYDIVHNSTVIGKTSAAFSEKLAAEFGGRRYFAALPEKIGGVYVTDIVTVVSCRDPSEYEGIISPQFRDHRFWYGVELSGFGEAE